MLNNSSLQLHCLAALQNPVVTWTWTVALFQVSSSHMLDLADRQDCYSCMPAFRLATMKPFAERTAKDSPCMTCTQSLHSSLRLCCAMLSCVVACCAVPRRAVLCQDVLCYTVLLNIGTICQTLTAAPYILGYSMFINIIKSLGLTICT